MPVKVVFTCERCGVRPDPETQVALLKAAPRASYGSRGLRSTMGPSGP
jgi:hypothetical protein